MRIGLLVLVTALSLGFLLYFIQYHDFFKGNNFIINIYFAFAAFSFIFNLINILRDKDIEIIRHSEHTFDLNGERLLLDKNTDALEIYESSGREGAFYNIKIKYADRKMKLCGGLKQKDYDEYLPQISNFLGLPVTQGRSWLSNIFG